MRRMTCLILAFTMLCAGTALAQPMGPGGPMPPERFEKFKEKRGALLRKKVGLTDQEAAQVEAIMDRSHQARMELMEQMREARDRLEALLDQDSDDQEAYRSLLDEVLALRTEMHDLHTGEIAELRAVLTPRKATKLLAMMEKVHRKMRGRMHGHGGRGWGGDGPFPDGGPGPGPGDDGPGL